MWTFQALLTRSPTTSASSAGRCRPRPGLRRSPERVGNQHPRPRRESTQHAPGDPCQNDLKVSSIGSPIGKISIDDEFPPHLERMRHAVEVAKTLSRRRTSAPSSFPRAPTRTVGVTRCSPA